MEVEQTEAETIPVPIPIEQEQQGDQVEEGQEEDVVTLQDQEQQEAEGEILAVVKQEEDEDDGEGEELSQMAIEKQEAMQFDTSEEFNAVFGSKTEFDSWDEFSKYLDEFQTKTGTTFKPRSACSIDYANERRINGPIPERFVYSNVKMICFHFGTSLKRGSGQKRNYVGKGCAAFMNVSYNKGAMRITQSHHIHTNHGPIFENDQNSPRNFRVFNFTEQLDLLVAREVNRVNPFEYANGEKQWIKAVDRLKEDDERFSDITPRLIKKRIRFLVDKFLAITHGRRPPAEDEMGNILYELNRAKKDTMDSLVIKGKKKRGPGRPRKKPLTDDEDFYGDDDDAIYDSAPAYKRRAIASPPSSSTSSQPSKGDITLLLSYLKGKDEEDRRLRQKEVEEDRRIRLREIDIRKEELAFQRERYEFEKAERRAHLDLLKAQLQTFEHTMMTKQALSVAPKDGNQVTEYTIVVDGNNQVLESLPTLG